MLVFYCRGRRPRRPAYRCFGFNIICIFYTMFGAKIYNIVCFFSFVTNPSLAASMSGCRGRQPLHICVYSLSAAKSLSLFADFTLYKKLQKRCRDLFSDTAMYFALVRIIIFSFHLTLVAWIFLRCFRYFSYEDKRSAVTCWKFIVKDLFDLSSQYLNSIFSLFQLVISS